MGVKVSIKELDDVLMRDVGGKIAESGRYRSYSMQKKVGLRKGGGGASKLLMGKYFMHNFHRIIYFLYTIPYVRL